MSLKKLLTEAWSASENWLKDAGTAVCFWKFSVGLPVVLLYLKTWAIYKNTLWTYNHKKHIEQEEVL